jgi:hypothetical protein
MKTDRRSLSSASALATALFLGQACAQDTGLGNSQGTDLQCSIPQSQIQDGGPGKDGIPALTNPDFVTAGTGETSYLQEADRVVGIMVDGNPLAMPLNIFWWHEIVNLDMGGVSVAITHCPLTGSTLAFDRSGAGGAEFGVSGLLFRNNLIMYDRNDVESLWPQLSRGARCGPADGTALDMVPVVEMTWEGWLTLHPDTRVVSANTGYARDYQAYPYGEYDAEDNTTLLFPGDVDGRRSPKERVLGIPVGSGGTAFPFGVLEEMGPVAAIHTAAGGPRRVVFWDESRRAAMAYRAASDHGELNFVIHEERIVDEETGSVWGIDGVASEGPLAGQSLQAVPEAFVGFWFAWPAFYPDIQLWSLP